MTFQCMAASGTSVRRLGIDDGMSNNSVSCLYQDSRGFVWIGTFDGLNRYDGYSFSVFRNKLNDSSSIPNNRIVDIDEDSRGNIWVATKGGALKYNLTTTTFDRLYYFDHSIGKATQLNFVVNDLQHDTLGTQMLVGVAGKGLISFADKSSSGTQVPLMTGSHRRTSVFDFQVLNIKIDRSGDVWLLISGYGLAKYDRKAHQIRIVNASVTHGNTIFPDNYGNIWLGRDNGLLRYNIKKNAWEIPAVFNSNVEKANITNIKKGMGSCLLISSDGNGVFLLNPRSEKYTRIHHSDDEDASISSEAVYDAIYDSKGRLWIGTLRGGINVIGGSGKKMLTVNTASAKARGLSSDYIIAFAEEKNGNMWIGLDGEGLCFWDRKKDAFHTFRHNYHNKTSLASDNVSNIIRDRHNNIWVATYGGGIDRFDRASQTFRHYPCLDDGANHKNVWALFEDRDGHIWAGTCNDGKLYRYDAQQDRFTVFADLKNIISIFQDPDGEMWFGSFTGIYRLDRQKQKVISYLLGSPVRAFANGRKAHLWVATEGRGLLDFNTATGTFSTFSDNDGLAGNAVLNILIDKKGSLWISTFSGLSNFNPATKRFRNYYSSDGLQSNQFNYNAALLLNNGTMAFGGINGFSIFNPEDLKPATSNSSVYLTSIKVNNVPFQKDPRFAGLESSFTIKELRLPFDKAVFSVDFVALNLVSPQKIRYAYMLEGWDKIWNNPGTARTATYSRLQEGRYLLRIRCTDAEGVWSKNERQLTIIVLPPWWRTWWAYCLYVLVGVGMLWIYLRYKDGKAKMKYEIKLANLMVKQEHELNDKKLSFFTHIAHEFRTPLTLIINPVKEIMQKDPILHAELNPVYKSSKRLLSLVDQLLLFRKAESGEDTLSVVPLDVVEVCTEVFQCFQQQAKNRNMTFDFEVIPTSIELYADREKLEIMLFNLLSNAFKYTPDNGCVGLKIREEVGMVIVAVTDTGIGLPDVKDERLFTPFYQLRTRLKNGFGIGLYLVKKFAEMHHGQLHVDSTAGVGSSFSLRFLKGKAQFPEALICDESIRNSMPLDEVYNTTEDKVLVDTMPLLGADLFSDKATVLVVDDDADVRAYTRRVLETKYIVYDCENAENALALLKERKPDIIISDVIMNDISGIDFCKLIKESSELAAIPIVLFSASTSTEYKIKGLRFGADDYISKPFDNEVLLARIEGLLRNKNLKKNRHLEEVTSGNVQEQTISEERKILLERCIAFIEQNIDQQDFNVKKLAEQLGMSHSTLYKKIKQISGKSVNEFVRFVRLRRAGEMLITSDTNVSEAAYLCGFNDIKYFREQFAKLYGLKPTDYIKKYRKTFARSSRIVSPELKSRE